MRNCQGEASNPSREGRQPGVRFGAKDASCHCDTAIPGVCHFWLVVVDAVAVSLAAVAVASSCDRSCVSCFCANNLFLIFLFHGLWLLLNCSCDL